MCWAERMHFLQDVFWMNTIALVSIKNFYHYLFWDTHMSNTYAKKILGATDIPFTF